VSETRPGERFGALRRGYLFLAGSLMMIAGVGAIVLLAIFLALSRRRLANGGELLEAVLATAGILVIFGGLAAMGVTRVVAGVRGRPVQRLDAIVRVEAWYARSWYVASLVFWGVASAGLVAAATSPASFFLAPRGRGFVWYAFLWHLLLPLHVALHECGHALGGFCAGMRFGSLRVGWLLVQREGARLRWSWSPPDLAGLLGFQSAVPEATSSLGARYAIQAAAGPLVSILSGVACLVLGTEARTPSTAAGAIGIHVLFVSGSLGLLGGVANLAPFRLRSGLMSDGARILASLRALGPLHGAVILFQSQWAAGRRPRDWGVPPSTFLAAAGRLPRQHDTLLLAAAAVALDTGDRHATMEVFGRAFEGAAVDPLMRYELELQAAMFEAFEGRSADAGARLARLGPHALAPEYTSLAHGVVACATGRIPEACAALRAWEELLERTPNAAAVRVGNEWAEERLRGRLRAAAGGARAQVK
jgi:hypothetical protein